MGISDIYLCAIMVDNFSMTEKVKCSKNKDEQRACFLTAPGSKTPERGQKTPVLPV